MFHAGVFYIEIVLSGSEDTDRDFANINLICYSSKINKIMKISSDRNRFELVQVQGKTSV